MGPQRKPRLSRAVERRPEVPGGIALSRQVELAEQLAEQLARILPALIPAEPLRPIGPARAAVELAQIGDHPAGVDCRSLRDHTICSRSAHINFPRLTLPLYCLALTGPRGAGGEALGRGSGHRRRPG